MEVRLELGCLGIISGEQRRSLECYVDARAFRQRKTYDEYYVDLTNFECNLDLRDLMILAERFKIKVLEDSVMVTDLGT